MQESRAASMDQRQPTQNNDTPAWMQDPSVFSLDWFSLSNTHLVQCTKRYVSELKRWRTCKKLVTTSRLKGILKKIMTYLHMHMRHIDQEKLLESELEEELMSLTSMYMDMELKVWMEKRKTSVIKNESVTMYEQNMAEKFLYWLFSLLSSRVQRVDTLMDLQMVYIRQCRPVLDPVFRKVLSEMEQGPLSDEMYVRYMLAFKLWREQVMLSEDSSSLALKTFMVNNLVPSNPFSKFNSGLRKCLRNVPTNVSNVSRFHMMPHNVNLKDSCELFLKCSTQLDKVIGNISKINTDFGIISDDEDEVSVLMKKIEKRKAKKNAFRTLINSRNARVNNPNKKITIIDLTQDDPEPSTSQVTDFVDLTKDIKSPPYIMPLGRKHIEKDMNNYISSEPWKNGYYQSYIDDDLMFIPPPVSFVFMCSFDKRRKYEMQRRQKRARREHKTLDNMWRKSDSWHHNRDQIKIELPTINEDDIDTEDKDTDASQDGMDIPVKDETYVQQSTSDDGLGASLNSDESTLQANTPIENLSESQTSFLNLPFIRSSDPLITPSRHRPFNTDTEEATTDNDTSDFQNNQASTLRFSISDEFSINNFSSNVNTDSEQMVASSPDFQNNHTELGSSISDDLNSQNSQSDNQDLEEVTNDLQISCDSVNNEPVLTANDVLQTSVNEEILPVCSVISEETLAVHEIVSVIDINRMRITSHEPESTDTINCPDLSVTDETVSANLPVHDLKLECNENIPVVAESVCVDSLSTPEFISENSVSVNDSSTCGTQLEDSPRTNTVSISKEPYLPACDSAQCISNGTQVHTDDLLCGPNSKDIESSEISVTEDGAPCETEPEKPQEILSTDDSSCELKPDAQTLKMSIEEAEATNDLISCEAESNISHETSISETVSENDSYESKPEDVNNSLKILTTDEPVETESTKITCEADINVSQETLISETVSVNYLSCESEPEDVINSLKISTLDEAVEIKSTNDSITAEIESNISQDTLLNSETISVNDLSCNTAPENDTSLKISTSDKPVEAESTNGLISYEAESNISQETLSISVTVPENDSDESKPDVNSLKISTPDEAVETESTNELIICETESNISQELSLMHEIVTANDVSCESEDVANSSKTSPDDGKSAVPIDEILSTDHLSSCETLEISFVSDVEPAIDLSTYEIEQDKPQEMSVVDKIVSADDLSCEAKPEDIAKSPEMLIAETPSLQETAINLSTYKSKPDRENSWENQQPANNLSTCEIEASGYQKTSTDKMISTVDSCACEPVLTESENHPEISVSVNDDCENHLSVVENEEEPVETSNLIVTNVVLGNNTKNHAETSEVTILTMKEPSEPTDLSVKNEDAPDSTLFTPEIEQENIKFSETLAEDKTVLVNNLFIPDTEIKDTEKSDVTSDIPESNRICTEKIDLESQTKIIPVTENSDIFPKEKSVVSKPKRISRKQKFVNSKTENILKEDESQKISTEICKSNVFDSQKIEEKILNLESQISYKETSKLSSKSRKVPRKQTFDIKNKNSEINNIDKEDENQEVSMDINKSKIHKSRGIRKVKFLNSTEQLDSADLQISTQEKLSPKSRKSSRKQKFDVKMNKVEIDDQKESGTKEVTTDITRTNILNSCEVKETKNLNMVLAEDKTKSLSKSRKIPRKQKLEVKNKSVEIDDTPKKYVNEVVPTEVSKSKVLNSQENKNVQFLNSIQQVNSEKLQVSAEERPNLLSNSRKIPRKQKFEAINKIAEMLQKDNEIHEEISITSKLSSDKRNVLKNSISKHKNCTLDKSVKGITKKSGMPTAIVNQNKLLLNTESTNEQHAEDYTNNKSNEYSEPIRKSKINKKSKLSKSNYETVPQKLLAPEKYLRKISKYEKFDKTLFDSNKLLEKNTNQNYSSNKKSKNKSRKSKLRSTNVSESQNFFNSLGLTALQSNELSVEKVLEVTLETIETKAFCLETNKMSSTIFEALTKVEVCPNVTQIKEDSCKILPVNGENVTKLESPSSSKRKLSKNGVFIESKDSDSELEPPLHKKELRKRLNANTYKVIHNRSPEDKIIKPKKTQIQRKRVVKRRSKRRRKSRKNDTIESLMYELESACADVIINRNTKSNAQVAKCLKNILGTNKPEVYLKGSKIETQKPFEEDVVTKCSDISISVDSDDSSRLVICENSNEMPEDSNSKNKLPAVEMNAKGTLQVDTKEKLVEHFAEVQEIIFEESEKFNIDAVESCGPVKESYTSLLYPVEVNEVIVFENCMDEKEYLSLKLKSSLVKCSVNGEHKVNKPVLIHQHGIECYLPPMIEAEYLDVGYKEHQIVEYSDCNTVKFNTHNIHTGSNVHSSKSNANDYDLRILAATACSLVHLDTNSEKAVHYIKSDEHFCTLSENTMCIVGAFPMNTDIPMNLDEDKSFMMKNNTDGSKVNIKVQTAEHGIFKTKELALEDMIQSLKEASKNESNDNNYCNDIFELFNKPPDAAPTNEPDISSITIPNTAHLQLSLDDDDDIAPVLPPMKKIPKIHDLNLDFEIPIQKPAEVLKPDNSVLKHSMDKILQNEIPAKAWNSVAKHPLNSPSMQVKTRSTDYSQKPSAYVEQHIPRRTRSTEKREAQVNAAKSNAVSTQLHKYKNNMSQNEKQLKSSPVNNSFGYIRSSRPMPMHMTSRKRKNNDLFGDSSSPECKKPSTEEMFEKLLEEHKREQMINMANEQKNRMNLTFDALSIKETPNHQEKREIKKNQNSVDINGELSISLIDDSSSSNASHSVPSVPLISIFPEPVLQREKSPPLMNNSSFEDRTDDKNKSLNIGIFDLSADINSQKDVKITQNTILTKPTVNIDIKPKYNDPLVKMDIPKNRSFDNHILGTNSCNINVDLEKNIQKDLSHNTISTESIENVTLKTQDTKFLDKIDIPEQGDMHSTSSCVENDTNTNTTHSDITNKNTRKGIKILQDIVLSEPISIKSIANSDGMNVQTKKEYNQKQIFSEMAMNGAINFNHPTTNTVPSTIMANETIETMHQTLQKENQSPQTSIHNSAVKSTLPIQELNKKKRNFCNRQEELLAMQNETAVTNNTSDVQNTVLKDTKRTSQTEVVTKPIIINQTVHNKMIQETPEEIKRTRRNFDPNKNADGKSAENNSDPLRINNYVINSSHCSVNPDNSIKFHKRTDVIPSDPVLNDKIFNSGYKLQPGTTLAGSYHMQLKGNKDKAIFNLTEKTANFSRDLTIVRTKETDSENNIIHRNRFYDVRRIHMDNISTDTTKKTEPSNPAEKMHDNANAPFIQTRSSLGPDVMCSLSDSLPESSTPVELSSLTLNNLKPMVPIAEILNTTLPLANNLPSDSVDLLPSQSNISESSSSGISNAKPSETDKSATFPGATKTNNDQLPSEENAQSNVVCLLSTAFTPHNGQLIEVNLSDVINSSHEKLSGPLHVQQAHRVVRNWINMQNSNTSYINCKDDECNLFDEVSSSSVHNVVGVLRDKEKATNEYQTPDSGVVLDEDKATDVHTSKEHKKVQISSKLADVQVSNKSTDSSKQKEVEVIEEHKEVPVSKPAVVKTTEVPTIVEHAADKYFNQVIESIVTDDVQQVVDVVESLPGVEEMQVATPSQQDIAEPPEKMQLRVSIDLSRLTKILPMLRKRKNPDIGSEITSPVVVKDVKRRRMNAENTILNIHDEILKQARSDVSEMPDKLHADASKNDYTECLYGIHPSFCSYHSDIKMEEDVFEEGGIDLYHENYDNYYPNFDSLKEQQPLQTGYLDAQFAFTQCDDDLFSIANNKMITVSMNVIQPKKKTHVEGNEEIKAGEFEYYETDKNFEGIVESICKNLDSETVAMEVSVPPPAKAAAPVEAAAPAETAAPMKMAAAEPVRPLYPNPISKSAPSMAATSSAAAKDKDDDWRENPNLLALLQQLEGSSAVHW